MPVRIDVWSDVACPWCYVGKRRLEAALAVTPGVEVEVVWRSFELDPDAPAVRADGRSNVERLAAKYRRTVAEAQAMVDNLTAVAATEGLALRFDRMVVGNTFDAHRLLHLAARAGCQGALKERLLAAYFTEGRTVSDRATLVELAGEVGLASAEVEAVLAGDAHAEEVRADEALARELGISGVPCFVIDRRFAVSGAQPAAVLAAALAKATASAAAAPACGPDGCA
ncbi:MAG: DsbA family oxidoreductase [Kofleriaceae bacterium]